MGGLSSVFMKKAKILLQFSLPVEFDTKSYCVIAEIFKKLFLKLSTKKQFINTVAGFVFSFSFHLWKTWHKILLLYKNF